MYKQVLDHQIIGAEISYVFYLSYLYFQYTYQKHIKKCKDLSGQDLEKLLNCYNSKVDKISKRFGSYYFNQRINLMNRMINKKDN